MLRTDAQVTQMMDCRSPDASQCFNMPDGARWAPGREAARNVDADGTLITKPGVRGCANLPAEDWSDSMAGPLPYSKGICPVAFPPSATSCQRYTNTAICSSMKTGQGCWPGAGAPEVATFNATNLDCWTVPFHKFCPSPRPQKKRDVFEECTPGSGGTCCNGLQCVKVSPYWSQCCLGPGSPSGCGAKSSVDDSKAGWLSRKVPASKLTGGTGCGVQFVSPIKGYETDALGRTAVDAIDRCTVVNHVDYNAASKCTAPPAKSTVCDGNNMAMRLVKYPEYGTKQYECRPTK